MIGCSRAVECRTKEPQRRWGRGGRKRRNKIKRKNRERDWLEETGGPDDRKCSNWSSWDDVAIMVSGLRGRGWCVDRAIYRSAVCSAGLGLWTAVGARRVLPLPQGWIIWDVLLSPPYRLITSRSLSSFFYWVLFTSSSSDGTAGCGFQIGKLLSKKCNQVLFAKISFSSLCGLCGLCVFWDGVWVNLITVITKLAIQVLHSIFTLGAELRFKLNPLRSHALTHLPQQLCRSRSPHPSSHSRYVTRTDFIHFAFPFLILPHSLSVICNTIIYSHLYPIRHSPPTVHATTCDPHPHPFAHPASPLSSHLHQLSFLAPEMPVHSICPWPRSPPFFFLFSHKIKLWKRTFYLLDRLHRPIALDAGSGSAGWWSAHISHVWKQEFERGKNMKELLRLLFLGKSDEKLLDSYLAGWGSCQI